MSYWLTQSQLYLWYENKADGESGREECEERDESVGGVYLLFDHERRRDSDQTEYDHVVHADTCTNTSQTSHH